MAPTEKLEDIVDMRDADVHPTERRVVIIGNCKGCKHWADKAWDEGQLISVVDGAGRAACIEIGSIRESEDEEPDELAVVAALGMGDCLLRTRGDFGCVLWEAKEIT